MLFSCVCSRRDTMQHGGRVQELVVLFSCVFGREATAICKAPARRYADLSSARAALRGFVKRSHGATRMFVAAKILCSTGRAYKRR